jgi:hypothetical protein
LKELILLGSLISILLNTGVAYGQMGQQPLGELPDGENMSGSAIENNMSDAYLTNSPGLDSPELPTCTPGIQPDGMCRDSGSNTSELQSHGFVDK